MDTSDPEIHFNEVGRCNHCADKDPLDPEISRARYQTLGDQLKDLVYKIKKDGKRSLSTV